MDAFILIRVYDELAKIIEEMGGSIDLYVDGSIGQNINKKEEKKGNDEDGGEEEEKENTKSKKQKKLEQKRKNKEEGFEKKDKKKTKKPQPKKPPQFKAGKQYADFYENKTELKFLVDNMLHKLVMYMRNVGLDAEFLPDKDHKVLSELAKAEKRVIITRDQKYFERAEEIPCLFIQD